jgi:hypothetical protein
VEREPYPPSPNLPVPQYPDPPCRILPQRDKGVVSCEPVEKSLRGAMWCPQIVVSAEVPWDIDKMTPAARVLDVMSQQEKEEFCLEQRRESDINICVINNVLCFDTFD